METSNHSTGPQFIAGDKQSTTIDFPHLRGCGKIRLEGIAEAFDFAGNTVKVAVYFDLDKEAESDGAYYGFLADLFLVHARQKDPHVIEIRIPVHKTSARVVLTSTLQNVAKLGATLVHADPDSKAFWFPADIRR